jgi:glyoxylase-like metal-dependent hydrolase (beta-lactamase superfamily II)
MLRPAAIARPVASVAREALLHGWPDYVRPLLGEAIGRPPIREILPGVHHWTRIHPAIRMPVSSYYVEPAGLLIDPLVPREGLGWFEGRTQPEQVVLTIGLHRRESARFADAFGCRVRCHEAGVHRFGDDAAAVTPFRFGDELAPGITALEVGALAPDDTALHLAVGDGAMAFGDGVIRPGGGALRFVPDLLMGDDPAAAKAGLLGSLARLLDRDFDTLLFAHGTPLVGGGKRALAEFVRRGG